LVPPPSQRLRILVVDDNVDAADMLAWTLSAHGYYADVAYDAPQALVRVSAALPDVAFIDIGLPVMDGYELARHLRATAKAGAMRLIAVTGYGQPADRARSLASGFEAHLVKPVERETIAQVLHPPAINA
jgi:CheY-like chemotaxis protein